MTNPRWRVWWCVKRDRRRCETCTCKLLHLFLSFHEVTWLCSHVITRSRGVSSSVHAVDVADLDAPRRDAHPLRWLHFLVVLVPRDQRFRRGGGITEQLDRVAVPVNEERRRDVTEHRRRCNFIHTFFIYTLNYVCLKQKVSRILEHGVYRMGPKKESYCTLPISSLSINQFLQYFVSKLCKKFAIPWHAHHTYYVATLPRKT